jgi:hypothetical protein
MADIVKQLDEDSREIVNHMETSTVLPQEMLVKIQTSTLFLNTSDSSNSSACRSKSGKAKKCVSFCESDQFYDTLYQTPFVNEEEEIIEDALHVDIESMISGDDCSSSHVSFTTLDKATAGSAFDTESFEDFPLRLSQVESEGPDRFSMDLVIQKLMNFQISLQPTIATETVGDVAAIATGDNNLSNPAPQSAFMDDDDEFIDRRQFSSNDDIMLELIRAASQSLIDHFKPSQDEPDESTLKKLQEDSMQMLLNEESDDENPVDKKAHPPTQVPTGAPLLKKNLLKADNFDKPSVQAAIREDLDIGFIGLDDGSFCLSGNVAASHHVIPNANGDFKEHTQLTSTSQSILLEHQTLPSTEISTSRMLPESSSSYFKADLKECSSSSKVPVLEAPISSITPLNQLAAPTAVSTTEETKAESQPKVPIEHSGSSPLPMCGVTTLDIHAGSSISTATSLDMERSSSYSTQSDILISSSSYVRGTQHLNLSNGDNDSDGHCDTDSLDCTPTFDNPISSTSDAIAFSAFAVSQLPPRSGGTRGILGGTYDCSKECSVATTIPCDSRRPSMYDTPPPTARDVVSDQTRVSPCSCVVPVTLTADSVDEEAITGLRSRRHERLQMHETTGIDMAKGRERYLKWKLYWNVFLLWLLLPILFCVIVYGVIPYDYAAAASNSGSPNNTSSSSVQRTNVRILKAGGSVYDTVSIDVWAACLIPWVLIMASASACAVQVYSSVISEVEFGVQIWKDSPLDYFKVAALTTSAALAMQILIFTSWGAGHVRNWLCMIAVASAVVGIMLQRMFYNNKGSETISAGKTDIFKRFMRGIFVLFCVSGVGFTIFTIVYAQFAILRSGSIGFLFATFFPLCRIILQTVVERCPGIFWRDCQNGLCASTVVTLVMCMWHGVFLSLIAACVASIHELIVLGSVELSLQLLVIYIIFKLPPPCAAIKDAYDDGESMRYIRHNSIMKNSRILNFGFEARRKVAVNSDCDIEFGMCGQSSELIDYKNADGMSLTAMIARDAKMLPDEEACKGTKADLVSPYSSHHISHEIDSIDISTTALQKATIKGCGRARTRDDDVYESRFATWLGVTWISGALTPLAFLICSALLSIGPNRRLFSAKVNNWRSVGGPSFGEVADIEVVAGIRRLWSLSIFDRDASDLHKLMWSVPTSARGSGYSEWGSAHLVAKMLCVSLAHMLMLAVGLILFRRRESKGRKEVISYSRRGTDRQTNTSKDPLDGGLNDSRTFCESSCDLCGLVSALLEYHYNIIALSTVMTMAIVLSVVFPWYGMNTSF